MFAPLLKRYQMNSAINTRLKYTLTAVLLAVFTSFTISAKAEETGKPAKFDAGKMIIEHITDSHEWHVLGEGEHTVAIPLPVILYTGAGLEVFMSSNFNHGETAYTGKYNTYKLNEKSQVMVVDAAGKEDEAATAKVYDFSITKNVASMFVSVLLLLYVFLSVGAAYKRNPNTAPKGMQSLFEPIIVFIRDDVAKSSIGAKKYEKFMPYLLTVFFFILFNNLLGIIPVFPGGANLTGNISVTMVLALLTFVIILLNGNKHYWGHILAMPGVPGWVLFILTPIEILGVFIRPFVLMVRLFANMSAGHIIALSLFSLIFIFGEMSAGIGWGVSVMSVAFALFMGLLELLVAFIQAYVFTLLSAIYFGAAVEEANGHEESVM